jgi:hypothetical protein
LPLCVFLINEPLQWFPLPFPTGPEEKVFDEVILWIKKEKPIKNKLYVLNPYLVFKLDMDPYDQKTVGLNFPPVEVLQSDTHPGELLVWDSHFGPGEAHVPLDSLMNNKFFMLKALFAAEESFFNSQGMPYEIYVFERMADTVHRSNLAILKDLRNTYFKQIPLYVNTFPNSKVYRDSTKTDPCFLISKDLEFSPGMDTLIKQCNLGKNRKFVMSVDLYPLNGDDNSAINMVAASSLENDVYMYQSFPVKFKTLEKNKWNHVEFRFVLPEIKQENAKLTVYLWNNEKNQALIDNLKVCIIDSKKNY